MLFQQIWELIWMHSEAILAHLGAILVNLRQSFGLSWDPFGASGNSVMYVIMESQFNMRVLILNRFSGF